MRNNFFIIIIYLFISQPLIADNLSIQSKNILIDKKNKTTVFKEKVVAIDSSNNELRTEYAEYNKNLKLLKSRGKTDILTSEGFLISGKNIIFDNKNNIIKSNDPAEIKDLESNNIYLDKFEYSTKEKFFKSTGNIEVVDSKNNKYNFSQIYIDERKREIIGTDIKAYLNESNFKLTDKNKPRIFANTINLKDQKSVFTKSVFTLCDYREDDKCPPWTIRASQMNHDKKKKTIYYDNAVIKVYDIPIFYFPRLSHPDPSVERRTGFLNPSFADSKNLGAGLQIPYFFALNKDKDLTLTPKLYVSENPIILGEYRQAFESSNFILDFGYTQGYKKTTATKSSGDKSHLFTKFVKNFTNKKYSNSTLELTTQHTSNDKYLKLYKINTDLVDSEINTLENSISFTHSSDDFFFGASASSYETLTESYNDKYEHVLPDIFFDKSLFSSIKYGDADFNSNFKIHNYETNKYKRFLNNNIDWKLSNLNYQNGLSGSILGKVKNVNYETKNESKFKDEPTSEVFGALGYLAEINLKKIKNNSKESLIPKFLLRFSPEHMRKSEGDTKLNHLNIFNLDRLNSDDNFESGMSATVGFDYLLNKSDREFNLSMGQIINEKENKHMPSSSSLDEKLSDVIGNSNLKINESVNLQYNFALDQNYKNLNYNELGADLSFNPIKFSFDYLQEKKHIGNQEYLKSKVELVKGSNGVFTFENKRNLITDSSEFYNLSYEYINDCLRAGLVYRREFYEDSELESENSLMFKITLTPFGDIKSPSFGK